MAEKQFKTEDKKDKGKEKARPNEPKKEYYSICRLFHINT